jgi:hypothetical protein
MIGCGNLEQLFRNLLILLKQVPPVQILHDL